MPKPLFQSIFDWFSNNDYGPVADTNNDNRQYPHIHSWDFYSSVRCGWRVEDGRPVGQRMAISLAILELEKHPNKNETTVSQLRGWRKSGYEYVHTSQTVYRCKNQNCSKTKSIDAFVAPVKVDGTGPLVIIDNDARFQKKFTQTTQIPNINTNNVNTRREVPVEPMKRHGARPKSVRPAPMVLMED